MTPSRDTGDVLILCYHAVSVNWPAALAVSPSQLEDQLGLLVERGYRGATFHDALTAPSTDNRLVVTFDDGYRSVADEAFPILSRLGLPGTVFVVTRFIGVEGPMAWPGIDHWLGTAHEPELTPLSGGQLRELARAGWEIGSHTDSHPRLTELDRATVETELRISRERCEEELGAACRSLAYPYGAVDAGIAEAAQATGYEAACTLPARLPSPERFRWPRVGIYRADSHRRFQIKVSPRIRRLRALPLWTGVDMLRNASRLARRSARR